jgi:hypothetical protein
MLKALEVPPAPANFTAAVVQRIRRDRWRAEQHVDRLFNLAIVFALLLVAGGIAAVLNVQAISTLAVSAWSVAKDGLQETLTLAAPTLATYVAAAALLATAFGMCGGRSGNGSTRDSGLGIRDSGLGLIPGLGIRDLGIERKSQSPLPVPSPESRVPR